MDTWPDWAREAATWALLMGAAVAGRLMYVLRQVQKGNRRFFSGSTLIDLIIAVVMGIIAHGACHWLGFEGSIEASFIAVAGYLGPHAIDRLFDRWSAMVASKAK